MAPRPTTPGTVPTITVMTTVPGERSLQTTTTAISTTTTVAPMQLVIAVTSGPLGCVFQPPAATVRQGSTMRFRNDTGGDISVLFPSLGAATKIGLEAGATSGALPLASAGSYAVTCTPGGDVIVGRMTLTVTAS
jgi:plastocyanin